MKNYSVIVTSILLTGMVLFGGCEVKTTKQQEKKLKEITAVFVKDSLKQEIDSLQITDIDTLTKMGYAKVNLEMLDNMQYQFYKNYNQALTAQDLQLSSEIEVYLAQIEEVRTDLSQKIADEAIDNKKPFMYMYEVVLWKEGGILTQIFFATFDYKIHQIDPFHNNLLDK